MTCCDTIYESEEDFQNHLDIAHMTNIAKKQTQPEETGGLRGRPKRINTTAEI